MSNIWESKIFLHITSLPMAYDFDLGVLRDVRFLLRVIGNFDKHQEHLARLCYSGRALDAPPRLGGSHCSTIQFQILRRSYVPGALSQKMPFRFGSTKLSPLT